MDVLERLQSLSNVLRLLHILRKIYSCNNECKTVNKQFKNWGALKQVSHHQFDCLGEVFCAIAVVTQLTIKGSEPLFSCGYHDSPYKTNKEDSSGSELLSEENEDTEENSNDLWYETE